LIFKNDVTWQNTKGSQIAYYIKWLKQKEGNNDKNLGLRFKARIRGVLKGLKFPSWMGYIKLFETAKEFVYTR